MFTQKNEFSATDVLLDLNFSQAFFEKSRLTKVIFFNVSFGLNFLQDYLFIDHPENFENALTGHFYEHSKKVLVLDDLYTDWLIHYSRKTDKPINSLVTSYLTTNNLQTIGNQKSVFRLLQFLSFSRRRLYFTKYLLSQKY